ncbi:MAG: HD domain-containing protein [Spirochaeta sp.]|jgi:PAS domain S-box-containing protein|nr:HD domain-containing protein [Spirochaeta sp.]
MNGEYYFRENPVPLMELDLSSVVDAINTLPSQRFTDVMEAINTAVIPPVTFLDHNLLVRTNAAMLSLLRANSEEELALWFGDVLGTEAFPAMIAGVLALRAREPEYRVETTNTRLDGATIQLRLMMRRAPDDDRLKRVLVSATDISRDITLREQIRSLAMMPETNPNVVLMMECDANITYANPTARRWMTSHGISDLNGLHELLPDNFHERYCHSCDHRSQRGEVYERHGRLYDLKITPVLGDKKCVLYANDVTETVLLQQERDTFFHAIEASDNTIVITDEAGGIEYVNPSFRNLYGLDLDTVRGKNPRIINPGSRAYWDMGVSEEGYRALFETMWRDLQSVGRWSGEVLNRVADGGVHWIRLIINKVTFEDGPAEKYLAVGTDVDTMRRQELDARLEILSTITRVAEVRDNETGQHMRRVGLYARLLSEQMGSPLYFSCDMERFAPLHDIGKVGISDEILLAPRRLTAEEFSTIKQHTTLGYSILAGKPSLELAAEIARDHHERYDGAGYPGGKAAGGIPLSARIVTVCDVYDALRSVRPYKAAWTHEAAREEILTHTETQFCPEVVQAFDRLHTDFQEVAQRYGDE